MAERSVAPAAPRKRWLVFGYGNPSRGDDALGPLFVERAQSAYADNRTAVTLEFLTDFQLQVEHALDLIGFDRVVFVDASVACPAPFEHAAVSAAPDRTLSSHMLSPQALLHVYRSVSQAPAPATSLLAIRGHAFELGRELSVEAAHNLDLALEFFGALITEASRPHRTGPGFMDAPEDVEVMTSATERAPKKFLHF